jgi:hypothetical protein
MPIGKAKSFIVPACMNMNAATMRSTLSSGGAKLGHFAIRFGAVIMFVIRSLLYGQYCCDYARLYFSAFHFSVITCLEFILRRPPS